jgi:hypothetical protein
MDRPQSKIPWNRINISQLWLRQLRAFRYGHPHIVIQAWCVATTQHIRNTKCTMHTNYARDISVLGWALLVLVICWSW